MQLRTNEFTWYVQPLPLAGEVGRGSGRERVFSCATENAALSRAGEPDLSHEDVGEVTRKLHDLLARG